MRSLSADRLKRCIPMGIPPDMVLFCLVCRVAFDPTTVRLTRRVPCRRANGARCGDKVVVKHANRSTR